MKKIVIILILIAISFFSYKYGYRRGVLKPNTIIEKTKDEIILPACDSGRCPEYESADVDGDQLDESLVYQPFGMTKGVATLMIIKNNKVVFERGGAQFSYKLNCKSDELATGMTLKTVNEWADDGIRPKDWLVEKWIFKDGNYVMENSKVTTD